MTPLEKLKKKEARRKKTIAALLNLHANPDPEMVFNLKQAKKPKKGRNHE